MDADFIYSALLCAAVGVCYNNAARCGFVFDDVSAVRDNKDLRPETSVENLFWNDFWGTPMNKERSHKSYRPLCVLTFRWNYAWGELDPTGYHVVNVALHAIVTVAFYHLCWTSILRDVTLTPSVSRWISFIAALLFAVHPVHTEAVTGVVGRAELLSSFFFIVALLMYSRAAGKPYIAWIDLVICVITVAIAMLCKEQGITVIGVCCVYEVFIAQRLTAPDVLKLIHRFTLPPRLRHATIRILFIILTSGTFMFARMRVMGGQLPVFTRFDNPAAMADSPWRQLTFNYMLPLNAWLLFCPSWLCCDWTMGTIPVIESFSDPRLLAVAAFYLVLLMLIFHALTDRCNGRVTAMALALIVFPFIPASNLFFPVGFVVAERVLYTPSMGFCLLIAAGFNNLMHYTGSGVGTGKRRWRRSMQKLEGVLLLMLIGFHCMKSAVRNYDWKDEYSLFTSGLRVNRANAKLFNNVGHALEHEQRWEEALKYFRHAAIVQPDDIGAHINVGRTYKTLERFANAESAYRSALALMPPVRPGQNYTTRLAPNHLNVYLNLANLLSRDPLRLEEADMLLRTAISMRADFTQAYINRGDVLLKLKRPQEAEAQYNLALIYENDNPDIYYNLGVVQLEQGRHEEAGRNFEKALALNPRHLQTLFNSAVLLQERGGAAARPEAYRRLRIVLELEPDNDKAYFNLAMLAMDDRNFTASRAWFDKTISLRPDFRSALFNAALLVSSDMGLPLEAVPYLKQLLQYYPRHTKGLILLGDININHLKNMDAAENCFNTILETEPENVQARHNLCVVYVERGDLMRAETCLIDVAKLAPSEQYIRTHLDIVRQRLRASRQPQAGEQQQQGQQKQQPPGQQQPGQEQQKPQEAQDGAQDLNQKKTIKRKNTKRNK